MLYLFHRSLGRIGYMKSFFPKVFLLFLGGRALLWAPGKACSCQDLPGGRDPKTGNDVRADQLLDQAG